MTGWMWRSETSASFPDHYYLMCVKVPDFRFILLSLVLVVCQGSGPLLYSIVTIIWCVRSSEVFASLYDQYLVCVKVLDLCFIYGSCCWMCVKVLWASEAWWGDRNTTQGPSQACQADQTFYTGRNCSKGLCQFCTQNNLKMYLALWCVAVFCVLLWCVWFRYLFLVGCRCNTILLSRQMYWASFILVLFHFTAKFPLL